MGWSMNDLRSRSRSLAAVSDDDASPRSTPPRVRPEELPAEQRSSGQRMSRRQSIEERARREAEGNPNSDSRNGSQPSERTGAVPASGNGQRLTKKQRRAARAAKRAKDRQKVEASQSGAESNRADSNSADSSVADSKGASQRQSDQNDRNPQARDRRSRKPVVSETENGVTSRPNRRRETEEVASDEEKFPWHFQFDDDEPDQLQASSPLLSRAFRATIG